MPRPRALVLAAEFPPHVGGIATYTADMARTIRRAGYAVLGTIYGRAVRDALDAARAATDDAAEELAG